jgi:hypothetical protein
MNATPNKPRKWFVGFSLEAAKLFGIGIVCLMVIWAAVIVSVKTGFAVPARWFALFYWTGALLWLIFRQHKDDLRIGEFWLALAAFLMVHVTVFAVVLQSYPAWRTIWFMFIFMVEGPWSWVSWRISSTHAAIGSTLSNRGLLAK